MTSRKAPPSRTATDVPADNPVGTMDRFAEGLKRVLTAHKRRPKRGPKHRRPHR